MRKIIITMDETLIHRVDRLIAQKRFANRSHALQEAMYEKLERMKYNHRLEHELAKLDVAFEKKLADEGLSNEIFGEQG